jgi:hypothetical protein
VKTEVIKFVYSAYIRPKYATSVESPMMIDAKGESNEPDKIGTIYKNASLLCTPPVEYTIRVMKIISTVSSKYVASFSWLVVLIFLLNSAKKVLVRRYKKDTLSRMLVS